MRSSYMSFVQFYGVLLLGTFLFYFDFLLNYSSITFSFIIGLVGFLLSLWLSYKIDFIRFEENSLGITNVFGRYKTVSKDEVSTYGRIYFQICWITLNNGKRVFFMQRTYDCMEDVFTSRASRLDKLFHKAENE